MIIWILFNFATAVFDEADSWDPEFQLEWYTTQTECKDDTRLDVTENVDAGDSWKVVIPSGVKEEVYDHFQLQHEDLDGSTCIPINLNGAYKSLVDPFDVNDPKTTHYARLWCVAADLMYIRVYRGDNHDNCMWETEAKKNKPTAPNNPTESTLQIEAFLPRDRCVPVYTAVDANADFGINGGAAPAASGACTDEVAQMYAFNFDCTQALTDWPPSDLTMACYGVPSARPTARPTARPSSRPTSSPTSWAPSMSPTKNPTSRPPSTCPSMKPTTKPSENPNVSPTTNPSSKPSAEPSNKPSPKPSPMPVVSPTPFPGTSHPTPPPTSPSSSPHTVNPTIAPTPHPTSAKPTTGSPTTTAMPTISSSPTPPPVSRQPATAHPVTHAPATEMPSSSDPSPRPSPPPNTASPTTEKPSPKPTPPPSEFDLESVTWDNIISRRFSHCANTNLLIEYEKTALRALCSWEESESLEKGGGWQRMADFMTCEDDYNRKKKAYEIDAGIVPETTTSPFFTTTTTAEQILYNPANPSSHQTSDVLDPTSPHLTNEPNDNTVVNNEKYEHPNLIKKPRNLYPKFYELLKCVYDVIPENGAWMKKNICAEVNSMPLGRMSNQKRDEFFDTMKSKADMCPNNWNYDLFDNMNPVTENTKTIHKISELGLYNSVNGVYKGVMVVCYDYENMGSKERREWVDEYHLIKKDDAWYEAKKNHVHYHRDLELPSFHDHSHTAEEENDYELILQFHDLSDSQQRAFCDTANDYDTSTHGDYADWWRLSKQHHYDDLTFWLKKFGHSQGWDLRAYESVKHAPLTLLMAFAENPSGTKETCRSNIDYVTDNTRVGGDIWNDLTMKNFKAYSRNTRYLMKKCWNDQNQDHARRNRKLEDSHDEICGQVQSWKQETQVGIDLSLQEFYAVIVRCEDEVVHWLNQQYNQQTNNRDAEEYYKKHISDKLGAGQPVMLKQWAYWVFKDDNQRYHTCFEWTRAEAQAAYIDVALKACESLEKVADTSLQDMSHALKGGTALNMQVFDKMVKNAYVNKFPATTSGWVAVKDTDGELEVVEVPGLEVHYTLNTDFSSASIQKALQDTLEIGVPSEITETTASWFDVTEEEIIAKMGNIVKLANHGPFALDGVEEAAHVLNIAFPVQFSAAHKSYETLSEGNSAAYVDSGCVINPLAEPEFQMLTVPESHTDDGHEGAGHHQETEHHDGTGSDHHGGTESDHHGRNNPQAASSASKFGMLSLFIAALYMY